MAEETVLREDLSGEDQPAARRTWIIIGVVVLVLICCCVALAVGLWFGGDVLIEFIEDLSFSALSSWG